MINPDIDWSIYEIYCKVTDRPYIGSAYDYKIRWNKHIEELNLGMHINGDLQSDWKQFGRSKFEFKRLKILSGSQKSNTKLYWFELKYIYEYYADKKLYNVPRAIEEQCYSICRQLIDHKIKFKYKEYLEGQLLDFIIYPDYPWTDDFFVVDVHDINDPRPDHKQWDIDTVTKRKSFCEERWIDFKLINPHQYFLLSDIGINI